MFASKRASTLIVSGFGLGDLLQIHFQYIGTRFGFSLSVLRLGRLPF